MAIIDPNGTARVLAVGAPAGRDGESAYQVWLAEGNTGSRTDFLSSLNGRDGEPGAKGIDGAGTVTTLIASTRILPSSAVVADGRFGGAPANPSNPAHANLVAGVTALGAEAGSLVVIQGSGDLEGISGNFAPGDTLFPSIDGTLTSIAPNSGWRQSVGKASSASRMIVNLGPAYVLKDAATLLVTPSDAVIQQILLAALTPNVLMLAYQRMVGGLPALPQDSAIPDAGGIYVTGGQPIVVPPKS